MQCVSARDLFQTCSFTLSYLKGLYSCLRIALKSILRANRSVFQLWKWDQEQINSMPLQRPPD